MEAFFNEYSEKLIKSFIILLVYFVIRFFVFRVIKKIAKSNNKNENRLNLILRYVSVTLFFIALFVFIFFVLEKAWGDVGLLFSSVFAVVGVGLFAIWSILSNVTSGVIMFFSFPYKVGDKIQIHDKDFPLTAIIEDIRAFQLHLRQENGDLITYPNNLILQKAVTLIKKDAFDELEELNENID